jgi:glutamyl-tRNA(Gln) amidotransferase subunit E
MQVKVGIEIHQRLNTRKKLFCNCLTLGNEKKICEIKRRLHPVPSELGKIDIAAQFEQLKGREFVYQIYEETVCDVCCDEEPPHKVNKDALEIALKICKLFNAKVVDEIHFMRKIVIDGSTPMGFQRTAIVGLDGFIDASFGKVRIPTICLEEESAGIIGEIERAEMGIFRLDRLGIPLIEISTEPVMKNGKETKEVAEKIGLALRVAGLAMRGIGTIRQDINVSIENGARVEIKGVQNLDLIEDVVEKEIKRQIGLMRICKLIKERVKESYEEKIYDVTDIFKDTGCKFVRESVWKGKKVFCLLLKGMDGILGEEIFPGYRYGSELSGYAKSVGIGGIIHSDEILNKYGFGNEISELEKRIGRDKGDAFVLAVGDDSAKKALKLIFSRAYATKVPEETRHALLDGKSEYMRPLPGASRLYPETDVPTVLIDKELYSKINVRRYEDVEKKIFSLLNKELANKMIRSEKLDLFLKLADKFDPVLVATTLEETIRSIKREGYDVEKIRDERIVEIFECYRDGVITKAAIPEIIKEISKKDDKVIAVIDRISLRKLNKNELKVLAEEIGDFEKIMREYRLIVDAEELRKILEEKERREKEIKRGKK